MAGPSAIERKAERILAEHSLEPGWRDTKIHCRCGWAIERTPDRGGGYNIHRAHQVEMLGVAGLLVAKKERKK
jgi:hypothetical protein